MNDSHLMTLGDFMETEKIVPLWQELEARNKTVVKGTGFISNAYNIVPVLNREEFMKLVNTNSIQVFSHSDLTNVELNMAAVLSMIKQDPSLSLDDFTKTDNGSWTLDREEYLCSVGAITFRFVSEGE